MAKKRRALNNKKAVRRSSRTRTQRVLRSDVAGSRVAAESIMDHLSYVRRGISAYVSYLAACGSSGVFSEYVLYEPIMRILNSRRLIVSCEYECPGVDEGRRGDKERIDFVAISPRTPDWSFAMEVKWLRRKSVDLTRDLKKLESYVSVNQKHHGIVLIFGKKQHISAYGPPNTLVEIGKATYSSLGRSKYGARTFRLRKSKSGLPRPLMPRYQLQEKVIANTSTRL
jgi:hypothetical protein